jgi:hypothetical protein
MAGRRRTAVATIAALLLAAAVAPPAAAKPRATWTVEVPLPGALDVTAPRTDGQTVVAAAGTLSLLRATTLTDFARDDGGYSTTTGEPYIALSNGARVERAHCRFARNDVFALEPIDGAPTVKGINLAGQSHDFAHLPAGSFLAGIAFDTVGDFDHRLLVAALRGNAADLWAIDCRGRSRRLGTSKPLHVEGGMAVAPRAFGRYGGRLIAADETGGNVVAFDADGHGRAIVKPNLPTGGDIGVESVGFLPRQAPGGTTALLADRGGQAEPHPGSDALLGVPVADLIRAGARPGDLLVATEGGAQTVAIRCPRTRCNVARVADGPPAAHAEGHIEFQRR